MVGVVSYLFANAESPRPRKVYASTSTRSEKPRSRLATLDQQTEIWPPRKDQGTILLDLVRDGYHLFKYNMPSRIRALRHLWSWGQLVDEIMEDGGRGVQNDCE
jgi:hypothetical protein